MAEESDHFLNELTIWKLKAVAEEYKIDVSQCRYKRDYVQKIASKKLTEEQVRSALAKSDASKARQRDEAVVEEVRAIGKEVSEIASRPIEPTELPKDEERNVERNIDEALMMRPSLLEVDSAAESAYNKMIVGDYYQAIKANKDSRMRCLEGFSVFQVYSAAVSIRAADELLRRLSEQGVQVASAVRTALAAAKKTFIDGSPRAREEALESLETISTREYESFVAKTEAEEVELRNLLADYESFGTRTEEPKRFLEIAAQAKAASNIGEYSKLVRSARDSAEAAKAVRAKEIGSAFHMVKASAAAARSVGVDTVRAEEGLEEAHKALGRGAFKRAADLLASIEQATDSAHMDQIRREKDLEARQVQAIGMMVAAFEPVLSEAASYGMQVQEGQMMLANSKTALARKDLVNAAKFMARVKEVVDHTEKELDGKRVERGLIKHVEGSKCSECGQESLYLYPNSSRKCLECGSLSAPEPVAKAAEQSLPVQEASTVAPGNQRKIRTLRGAQESPEEKKKKGLFRW